MFPLLEFLQTHSLYPTEEILKGKLELLAKTNMVDFAIEMFKSLHGATEDPKELLSRRTQVIERLHELAKESQPMTRIIDEVVNGVSIAAQLDSQHLLTLSHLSEHHGVTESALQAFFQYTKFQFDCGVYSKAAEYLRYFRRLTVDSDLAFSALWGELAAEILTQEWDAALEDLHRLREAIESRTSVPQGVLLQHRTWLMHWSLFVFFNHPNGRNGIIDWFFQEKYLNTIQVACPHLLRYLATAVITNKRRRIVLNDLVAVLKTEAHSYSDPITEFLECLYVRFDFESAQQKLLECDKVLSNDFFLVACRDEFFENARLFIFETYCRIHSCVDLSMLSEKLSMDQEAAERWIVNLIRNAKIDAKIDSAGNQVLIGNPSITIYQRIIENTRTLSTRMSQLSAQSQ